MIDNIIKDLNSIIEYTIYENIKLNDEMQDKLNKIILYMNNSKNIIKDLNSIIEIRNKENKIFLERYISIILSKTTLSFLDITKLLKTNISLNIKYILWNKLNNNNKINYLLNNNIDNDDISLINISLNNKNTKLYHNIISNEDILKKLKDLTPNINIIKIDDFNNLNILKVMDSKIVSKYIMKYYYTYNNFKKLVNNNLNILNYASKYSIKIDNIDKEDLNKLVLEYPLILTKLNTDISINNLTIDTLNTILNNNHDLDINSCIKELLTIIDSNNIYKYFNLDFIKQQKDFTLSIYPFAKLDNNLTKEIIHNYNLLKKFTYNTIVTIINNLYMEEDKITLFRNNNFIEEIPSYYLVQILNNMNFRNVFNLLQNINLLNKLDNLNIKLNIEDNIFINSYLDSPTLVNISNPKMLYNMLLLSNNVIKYLNLPYINSRLNILDIIDILVNKNINIFNSPLLNNFKPLEIKNYINKMLKKYHINYDLLINDYVFNNIYNYNKNKLTSMDLDNLKYLFDKIYTKGINTSSCYTIDIDSFKSLLSSYILLGFDNTNKLFENGTYNISFKNINSLKNIYVKKFKKDLNLLSVKKVNKLFSKYLLKLDNNVKENFLENYLLDIPEIKSYILLFNNTKYSSIKDTIKLCMNYLDYNNYNNEVANNLLTNFIKNFNSYYKDKWILELKNRFDKITIKSSLISTNILYQTEKNIDEAYTIKFKLDLFKKFLKSNHKDKYQGYFNIDLKDVIPKYLKYIKTKITLDNIINKVLVDTDINSILNSLNTNTPIFYNLYKEINKEEELITNYNNILKNKLKNMHSTRVITILNYICYNTTIPFIIDNKLKKVIKNIKDKISSFNGKVDVNKYNNTLEYTNIFTFNNLNELEEYDLKYQKINNILEKTNKFVDKYINTIEIKAKYKDYYKYSLDTYLSIIPVNKNYYSLKRRYLYLDDFKKIFNGYDLSINHYLSTTTKSFLVNNLVYVALGYVDDFTNNFGLALNKIDDTKLYNNIYELVVKN